MLAERDADLRELHQNLDELLQDFTGLGAWDGEAEAEVRVLRRPTSETSAGNRGMGTGSSVASCGFCAGPTVAVGWVGWVEWVGVWMGSGDGCWEEHAEEPLQTIAKQSIGV